MLKRSYCFHCTPSALRRVQCVHPAPFTFVLSPAQEFLTHEGYFVPDTGSSVGRGDVARFMLSLLSSNAWVKKGVAMTIK